MSANKLLLVDGSNLLFQMFYGMPARIVNRQGNAVHATVGFVGALLKIIKMTAPTHIGVLFDGEHENARAALDAEYKANRIDYSTVSDEDCPFTQLPDIYAALDYLGIKHAETTVCETDDWMAGYALTYGKDMQIVISSFDSDYFQLITDNVSVLRYRGVKTAICTPDYVTEHFGISPEQYADYKALTGDGSDNIKGAYKVGPKTAADLLKKFGTLENALEKAEQIERPKVRQAITSATERLRTNYKLIKLENYSPLPFGIDELAHDGIQLSSSEILKNIGILP
ncbi:MAG: 5'-3' exonuclease [Clostridiales bacterium]|nr:5'-3' exonuclease [Clostridiales bacterium]